MLFLLWIRCQHTQALLNLTLFFFLVVVTFEFISSALSLRMWQFEGEDLLQDDPNIMDFLMGLEDVFTEGVLGYNQQHPPSPPHPPSWTDPEYRGPLFSISTVLQKQDRCEWK